MDDAHVALESLHRGLDTLDNDVAQMEGSVVVHNRNMIALDAQLRLDIAALHEQVEALRADLTAYKKMLLGAIEEFKHIAHQEQIETLEKHINALGFERALTREQVKAMIERFMS